MAASRGVADVFGGVRLEQVATWENPDIPAVEDGALEDVVEHPVETLSST